MQLFLGPRVGIDDDQPAKAVIGAQAIGDDVQGSFLCAYAVMLWEGLKMGDGNAVLTRSRFGGART